MSDSINPLVDEMFSSGVHFGYSKTRRHPSVARYIFTTKNKVDIIDVEKTAKLLETAEAFMEDCGKKGKVVLFVGVKPEAKELIREMADKIGMPYVCQRWVGGVLTNFPEIKKRIDRLALLKEQKESGELEKYTKKERLLIDEEIAKMHGLFFGLANMKKIPDALFIVDAKREHIAVKEAVKVNIPVIALVNTDTNIKGITYPVVGNDSSRSSIKFFIEKIMNAYKKSTSL